MEVRFRQTQQPIMMLSLCFWLMSYCAFSVSTQFDTVENFDRNTRPSEKGKHACGAWAGYQKEVYVFSTKEKKFTKWQQKGRCKTLKECQKREKLYLFTSALQRQHRFKLCNILGNCLCRIHLLHSEKLLWPTGTDIHCCLLFFSHILRLHSYCKYIFSIVLASLVITIVHAWMV